MNDERSLTSKETGGLRNRRGRNIKFAKLRLGGAGPEHTLDFGLGGLPDRPLAKPPEWTPTRLPDCFIPLLHSGASISFPPTHALSGSSAEFNEHSLLLEIASAVKLPSSSDLIFRRLSKSAKAFYPRHSLLGPLIPSRFAARSERAARSRRSVF